MLSHAVSGGTGYSESQLNGLGFWRWVFVFVGSVIQNHKISKNLLVLGGGILLLGSLI